MVGLTASTSAKWHHSTWTHNKNGGHYLLSISHELDRTFCTVCVLQAREAEAWGRQTTCRRPHSPSVGKAKPEPRSLCPKSHAPPTSPHKQREKHPHLTLTHPQLNHGLPQGSATVPDAPGILFTAWRSVRQVANEQSICLTE